MPLAGSKRHRLDQIGLTGGQTQETTLDHAFAPFSQHRGIGDDRRTHPHHRAPTPPLGMIGGQPHGADCHIEHRATSAFAAPFRRRVFAGGAVDAADRPAIAARAHRVRASRSIPSRGSWARRSPIRTGKSRAADRPRPGPARSARAPSLPSGAPSDRSRLRTASSTRTLPGSATRDRSLRIRSTIIRFSARSLTLRARRSLCARSSSGSRPRGAVPFIGRTVTAWSSSSKNSSGEAAASSANRPTAPPHTPPRASGADRHRSPADRHARSRPTETSD